MATWALAKGRSAREREPRNPETQANRFMKASRPSYRGQQLNGLATEPLRLGAFSLPTSQMLAVATQPRAKLLIMLEYQRLATLW